MQPPSKLTYIVLREPVSDHSVDAPVVVGEFVVAEEAVRAARGADSQWARVTIRVAGWKEDR